MTLKNDILEDLRKKLKNARNTRDSVLDQLTLMDVQIDQIDKLIRRIDKKIPPILDTINSRLTEVKNAYDNRINLNCRSDLKWELTVTQGNKATGGSPINTYTCVKNDTREQRNLYGQKYYRKPLNRDFGSNLIKEFTGTIKDQSKTLAVVSVGGTNSIRVGDIITDDIESPEIFTVGDLPKVVGFGTTSIIGVTTTLGGSIGVGSDHFINVGIGTTLGINVGAAVSLPGILPEGTTVTGIGTADVIVPLYDDDAGTFTNTVVNQSSLILSNVALATTSNQEIFVGILTTLPSLLLDERAISDSTNGTFSVIRSTLEVDSDFDYNKSPLDPVTVGIMGSKRGLGHKTEIVNNGHPPGPKQWKEQHGDPEPDIGAGNVVYYEGVASWPVVASGSVRGGSATFSYAVEGQVLVSTSSTLTSSNATATNSIVPPTPFDANDCNDADTRISTAEAAASASALQPFVDEINELNSLSAALREVRDKKELQAYGMLQGAAYQKSEINEIKGQIDEIDSKDLTEYEEGDD